MPGNSPLRADRAIRQGVSEEAQEDLELIARWRANDQIAATLLVGRHTPALARFAASLGVRADIDEIVQDTFVRAFNALDSFRGESAFRTWLFSILRHLVMDRRRAAKAARVTTQLNDDQSPIHTTPLDSLIAEETSRRIEVAIEDLSPMQRQVFERRALKAESYPDIARALNTTEGAARVHFHHAVKSVHLSLEMAD